MVKWGIALGLFVSSCVTPAPTSTPSVSEPTPQEELSFPMPAQPAMTPEYAHLDYRVRCNRGEAEACTHLGVLADLKAIEDIDITGLFIRACELGDEGNRQCPVVNPDDRRALTSLQVQEAMKTAQNTVNACFKALPTEAAPRKRSKLMTDIVIDSHGHVLFVEFDELESDVDDQELRECVLRAVSKVKFPPTKPGRTANVKYPWIFRRRG